MKLLMNTLTVGLLCLLVCAIPAKATLEVGASIQISAKADFYAPLTPVGTWVEVGSYGRCWRPSGVAVGWKPYCEGYWAWTDCGWYWVSDEPWAWACYHYGYWIDDPRVGWVWMPDVEWAPAWVTWRYGGGYVGWAPAVPRVGFFASVPVAPFFFVEVGSFNRPIRSSTVIVNNTTIINKTTVIGGISAQTKTIGGTGAQRVMFNAGPSMTEIQKAGGGRVRTVSVHEAVHQTPVPETMIRQANQSTRDTHQPAEMKKQSAPDVREPVREPSGTEAKPRATEPVPREKLEPREAHEKESHEKVPPGPHFIPSPAHGKHGLFEGGEEKGGHGHGHP